MKRLGLTFRSDLNLSIFVTEPELLVANMTCSFEKLRVSIKEMIDMRGKVQSWF